MISKIVLVMGVLVTAGCLTYSAINQAPVNDEFGHFFAGLNYWSNGDLSLFNVNSPLVRSVATLPAYLGGMKTELPIRIPSHVRPEFELGRQMFIADPGRFQKYLVVGRLFVASITLIGGLLLFSWVRQLTHSPTAGVVAMGLWFSQPQILSHGVLITGDVICAVGLLAAARALAWTIEDLNTLRLIALGIATALALLAKFTALVILPVIVVAFVRNTNRYGPLKILYSVVTLGLIIMIFLSIPYRFAGIGKSLSSYQFVSSRFSEAQIQTEKFLNLLPGFFFSDIPVPLPEQVLLGLDRQEFDFEHGLFSFAAGRRGYQGWWWFYFYSLYVKLPIGTLVSIAAAVFLLAASGKSLRSDLYVPLWILTALLVITALKSGFAQQHRYILPAYPFLFLIVGTALGRSLKVRNQNTRINCSQCIEPVIFSGLFATILGSTIAAPHWMSAFNLFGGGNRTGFKCLFNDASDWGQDTYRVRNWINSHQGPPPIFVRSSFSGHDELKATGAQKFKDLTATVDLLPRPSWLVVSKSDYVIDEDLAKQIERLLPIELIGGTHMVYYLQ